MARSLRERRARAGTRRPVAVARPIPMPAPFGGLNTRDAIDQMPANDAILMDNMFPSEGKVSVREGKTTFCDIGVVGSIESLFEFHSGATNQLVAAIGGEIYNISSGTAVSISDVGSPYANDRWRGVNFNGVMPLVNGADAPRSWDGTTMTTPAWVGPVIANLSGVHAHKFRLYFWTGNDQSFWYGAPNAITGALTEFNLSRVTGLGGKLINVASWTVDGGSGPDDYIVLIFSTGAAVVYQGSDPGTAADWALVGIYNIPEPMGGNRCAIKVGSDLNILTKLDLVPLTAVLRGGYDYNVNKTKITGAIKLAAKTHSTTFGWQIAIDPNGEMLVINQPSYNSEYNQLVMNTTTGAWCRFVDMNVVCWSRYNGDLYMGGQDGIVYKLSGTSDDGVAIEASCIQAWSDLGVPMEKTVPMVRPVIAAEGSISFSMKVGFDFAEFSATAPSGSVSSGAPWDTSPWDTSPWSPEGIVFTEWRLAAGKGTFVAMNLKLSALQAISWLRTDYRAIIAGNP